MLFSTHSIFLLPQFTHGVYTRTWKPYWGRVEFGGRIGGRIGDDGGHRRRTPAPDTRIGHWGRLFRRQQPPIALSTTPQPEESPSGCIEKTSPSLIDRVATRVSNVPPQLGQESLSFETGNSASQ